MSITEFLLARIAEDEDRAKRAAFGWGSTWTVELDSAEDWATVHADGKRDMVGSEDGDVALHIARHDPARVLRECEAKRRIVQLYELERARRDAYRSPRARAAEDAKAAQDRRTQEARSRVAEDAALALAAVYSDHPDYDEAWRP